MNHRKASPTQPAPNALALHDTNLVQRLEAGEETAFVETVERHRVKIFAAALSLLRNRDDEEEIAQDTFIRAHRRLARFRGDSSLATWLHRIAINLSSNRPTPRRKTRVSNFPN
jgi:RNA polymerase sigma-70 factor (ECF subfamily)